MKLIERKLVSDWFTLRRYQTDKGAEYETVEVPRVVWNAAVRTDALRRRVRAWRNGLDIEHKRIRGLKLIDAGWKTLAVAHEVDVNPGSVSRWIRQRNRSKGHEANRNSPGPRSKGA